MGTPDNKLSELVDLVKSWIPRRVEPAQLSRDFWMPDHSCRVCYECDSQFTVFNRRHHCRICGRVFCAKCTANSIPAPSDEQKTGREDWERIRVCNYCYKQWEQGIVAVDNGNGSIAPTPGLSPSPSATSLASSKSSCTCNSGSSTVGSTPYSTGPYQRVPHNSSLSTPQSSQMDPTAIEQDDVACGTGISPYTDAGDQSSNQYSFCINRSDDEYDYYGGYPSDSESRQYCPVTVDDIAPMYGPYEAHAGEDNSKDDGCSPVLENFASAVVDGSKEVGQQEGTPQHGLDSEAPIHDFEETDTEPVDFENNGLLWLPPEPEDEEDEREAILSDDEDGEGVSGEWGYLRSSDSFGSAEYRSRDKSSEEHRKAMKNVVEGHFRALIAQLLQVENLSMDNEDGKDNWLDIIASLSWEAATLLKPDMSKGGGMDPGGYVKVKCIACGRRGESKVVKGVVCKKNVAHRRMTSKIDKPRLLILGGALEYQRVTNHLSSFDTLLQQEMDHLKMAVAKIDVHDPDVLLVEKSVSRHAQEYLLGKDISLVLNIKRPLLERIARCTGAQIVPSIDHLTSPKLGYCETFHVEKLMEEHGSAGQGGKKSAKTLMFFEGCPKPFGCTIFLKGANGDELKKVKHVVQYGIFAAYHLALETSFLADEGASLPELPLRSPLTVALPDKPSSIERSISTIPGFSVTYASPSDARPVSAMSLHKGFALGGSLPANPSSTDKMEGLDKLDLKSNELLSNHFAENFKVGGRESFPMTSASTWKDDSDSSFVSNAGSTSEKVGQSDGFRHGNNIADTVVKSDLAAAKDGKNHNGEMGSSKEEFPPSPSDHQSILVSLSTRCVWKGTVCEKAHLLRIKYYGCFDKPLGRFLRDHLFDQNYRCRSCDMPSEAHVHCYIHRQGSLTISVKKLPEFLLRGEREGKIWMWHRCLRCPRKSGFPPATRRVLMSDAAWGLSFGKFLELSFSNHAAASRVASCGHSLHRDCLRFYGFGRMVACFRYASIDVHSVYLPPAKIEFNYDNQDWIKKEANEVHERALLLFNDIYNALQRVTEKSPPVTSLEGSDKSSESRNQMEELEEMLVKRKAEFEDLLGKVLAAAGELKVGHPMIDILEINKLRRQLLFHSYTWDRCLIHALRANNKSLQESLNSSTQKPSTAKEKTVTSVEKFVETAAPSNTSKGFSSCDSFLLEKKPLLGFNQVENGREGSESGGGLEIKNSDQDLNHKRQNDSSVSSGAIIGNSDPLESGKIVRRALSEGEFPIVANLSDSLDAAWSGESHPSSTAPEVNSNSAATSSLTVSTSAKARSESDVQDSEQIGKATASSLRELPLKGGDNLNSLSSVGMSIPNIYSSFNTYTANYQKLGIGEYQPAYVLSCWESERQSGARFFLPVGFNDTIVPVYDDEPTSIIAYALTSPNYHAQLSDCEKSKDCLDSSISLPLFDSVNLLSLSSLNEVTWDSLKSFGSTDESVSSTSGSRSSQNTDPLLSAKDLHARVSFNDEGPQGKAKYTVTCYYAKQFEALRRISCPSELDFIRSLSRCKKWGAQGGKSNVFFAKTLDDRFIIKQVTKTELESFIKFAPAYFKYLSESISSGSPTCLAKIVGIYQVSSKLTKGGKETKMDVLVMENLLFRRNITRLYDLKGSSRARYNPDTSGSNKVLLDQNLIEAMPTSPIFVGNKAKRLLERAVWNDTAFLASIDVMDYSLLVGVDEERQELVLGIIDFMRQYTWDKHLETWVKTSGILGGPKNASPTVISPQMYKKRFRKAMTAYFLMVPDQWTPPTMIRSGSQSDVCEDNSQGWNTLD
ncbi:1-phosphatidylinositol-3-phosphate 5-kinase FAB1A-like isoform X2 [Rhodamnia argentea]|uniref:1-phosphatidylinositol-3-phosphate 5-kinase n=1 Tax=Rhodamnia argentea TaxID=178133 RepID=A0A8B8PUE7_9MYRT|nr:1-phosphatidylinositol-3-phosphate 5-kinase FAB1A-like isoform X2 [Rhodamnia argentea]